MDQKTTSGGSGSGTRKNWRERLGINKDLPKIAAEFKEERRPPPPPPPMRPVMPPAKGATGRLSTGTGQQIARPAPMAPRVGGGEMARPAGNKPGSAPPKLSPPRPVAAQPPVTARPAVPKPAPVEDVAEDVQPVEPVEEARPVLPPLPADNDFSARLRAQREAAERLASQRLGSSRAAVEPTPQADAEEPAEPEETEETEETVAHEEPIVVDDMPAAAGEETAEIEAQTDLEDAQAEPEDDQSEPEVVDAEPEEAEVEPEVIVAEPDEPVEALAQEPTRPKFGFAPEELSKPVEDKADENPVMPQLEPEPAPQPSPAPAPRAATAAALSLPPQTRDPLGQPRRPVPEQPVPPQSERTSLRGIDPEPARPTTPPSHGLAMPRGYPPAGRQPAGGGQVPRQGAGAGGPPPLRAPARPGEAAYSPYSRQMAPAGPALGGGQPPPPRAEAPLPTRSKPARSLDYVDDDLSEVFEDEHKPMTGRRRASAEDYSAAYQDFDGAFDDDEPQRSNGPIILILILVTVALIAGALVLMYRGTQGPDTVVPDTGKVPEIVLPTDPVKIQPKADSATQTPSQVTPRNKQIYDRIVGDEETTEPETIVPSEETPQLPSPTEGTTNEGTTQSGSETEPLPLPLPPPPGSDQQGAVPESGSQTTARSDQVEPAGTTTTTGLPIPEPAGTTGQTIGADPATTAGGTPPVQGGDMVAALPLPAPPAPVELAQPSTSEIAAPPDPVPVTSVNRPPKPRNRPTRLASLERARTATVAAEPAPVQQPATTAPATGSGPTLLAPSQTTTTQAQTVQPAPSTEPDTQSGFKLPNFLQQAQSGTTSETPRRLPTGRGDDDPLAGSRTSVNSTTSGTVAAPQQVTALQPQQQSAPNIVQQPAPSVTPQQPATPQAPATASSGYVVQLASYRSEGEALTEFQRLRSRHGGLIGNLSSRIQKAELGAAGTFYRLGVGPIGDKTSAKNLCNSLIAAGEKDCLVRRQ